MIVLYLDVGSKRNSVEKIERNSFHGDFNGPGSKISEISAPKNESRYQRGPVIESNNTYAEVRECLDLHVGERLAIKSYKVRFL